MLMMCAIRPCVCFSQSQDKETLNKALEYFGGQKYHESLLAFKSLSSKYELNHRFKAYMGICYYKVQDYEHAVEILDSIALKLSPYPPQEQAVYNFSNAESHFMLAQVSNTANTEEYKKAILYYEKALKTCRDSDKGDIYFRLGFCHFFCEEMKEATDCFLNSKQWYDTTNLNNDISLSRKKQVETMLKKLLVAHGTSRMDVGDDKARDDEHHDTDK